MCVPCARQPAAARSPVRPSDPDIHTCAAAWPACPARPGRPAAATAPGRRRLEVARAPPAVIPSPRTGRDGALDYHDAMAVQRCRRARARPRRRCRRRGRPGPGDRAFWSAALAGSVRPIRPASSSTPLEKYSEWKSLSATTGSSTFGNRQGSSGLLAEAVHRRPVLRRRCPRAPRTPARPARRCVAAAFPRCRPARLSSHTCSCQRRVARNIIL